MAASSRRHPWHGISAHAGDGSVVNVYVEIVPFDSVKYELDKATGHLRLDRPQRFSNIPPTLYGFIPQTYFGPKVAARCSERTSVAGIEGDGDAMDICVISEKNPAHGNFLARARPIGGLRMIDGKQADDKILAVLEADITFGAVRDVSGMPPGMIERLQHYVLTYKQGPHNPVRQVQIAETYGQEEAHRVLELSVADYIDEFGSFEDRAKRLAELLGR